MAAAGCEATEEGVGGTDTRRSAPRLLELAVREQQHQIVEDGPAHSVAAADSSIATWLPLVRSGRWLVAQCPLAQDHTETVVGSDDGNLQLREGA